MVERIYFVERKGFKPEVKGRGVMVIAKTGTAMRWYVQDEVSQEENEPNEVDGMKKEVDSTGRCTVKLSTKRAVGDL